MDPVDMADPATEGAIASSPPVPGAGCRGPVTVCPVEDRPTGLVGALLAGASRDGAGLYQRLLADPAHRRVYP